jgi:hypothetical protein
MPEVTPHVDREEGADRDQDQLGRSSMPNQSSSSGTQASEGIARSACRLGSSRRGAAVQGHHGAQQQAGAGAAHEAERHAQATGGQVPGQAVAGEVDQVPAISTAAASGWPAGRRCARRVRPRAAPGPAAAAPSGRRRRAAKRPAGGAGRRRAGRSSTRASSSAPRNPGPGAKRVSTSSATTPVQVRARLDQRLVVQDRRRRAQGFHVFVRRAAAWEKSLRSLTCRSATGSETLASFGQDARRLARIGAGPGARPFVGLDHARRLLRMAGQEGSRARSGSRRY